MEKEKALFLLLLSVVLLCSCVSINYKGDIYPATDKVEIIKNNGEKIPDGYKLIGTATATAPSEDYSKGEILDKLISKAKSVGADAIVVKSFVKVKSGETRADEGLNTADYEDYGWGLDGDTEGDTQRVDYDFIQDSNPPDSKTPFYKFVMKVYFLKKK